MICYICCTVGAKDELLTHNIKLVFTVKGHEYRMVEKDQKNRMALAEVHKKHNEALAAEAEARSNRDG